MRSVSPVSIRSRRNLLRAGVVGALGMDLPALYRAQAAAPVRGGTARACILVFYYGGPSHLDTWDPKPEAPAEIRGEFGTTATSAPGIRVSEHLPHCARVMHRLALVRSLWHPMRNHNSAAAEALTGRTPPGGDQELLQDDAHSFPCHGSVLAYARRGGNRLLEQVALPHVMYNLVPLPGQRAGFLGGGFDPFQVQADPNASEFRVPDLSLPAGLTAARMDQRQSLLARVERRQRELEAAAAPDPFYRRAFQLLASAEVRRAFDIAREPAALRDRYGRNTHGQSVLLARRLVESGVPFVSVYDRVHNGQEANWDSHQKVFERHRDHLLPPADRALAALIGDLEDRGLLESTLVVALGEFGRTPKINRDGGRDHWPDCFTAVLAGGGIRGGIAYGASDAEGAYPAADPVTPGDLSATMLAAFGVDPTAEMRDRTDRPYPLAAGRPLRALLPGAA